MIDPGRLAPPHEALAQAPDRPQASPQGRDDLGVRMPLAVPLVGEGQDARRRPLPGRGVASRNQPFQSSPPLRGESDPIRIQCGKPSWGTACCQKLKNHHPALPVNRRLTEH